VFLILVTRSVDAFKDLPSALSRLKKSMFVTMPDFCRADVDLSSSGSALTLADLGREKKLILDQSSTLSLYYPGIFFSFLKFGILFKLLLHLGFTMDGEDYAPITHAVASLFFFLLLSVLPCATFLHQIKKLRL
jgi:hypothetical protein